VRADASGSSVKSLSPMRTLRLGEDLPAMTFSRVDSGAVRTDHGDELRLGDSQSNVVRE